MKTISRYEIAHMPTWSLSYLVNNDPSGLQDDEIAMVDKWQASFVPECEENDGIWLFDIDTEKEGEEWEGHFSHRPQFGLACDCVACVVLILKRGS